ncbi:MAG: acyl-CoA dehydrogenase family protein, partial [Pirellulales bacterium]
MDFTWSDEQRELFTAIERFAAAELNEGIIERDEHGEFSRDGWYKCGEFGIHGLPVEEQYGGSDLDALATVGALERLGYACKDNGLIFS